MLIAVNGYFMYKKVFQPKTEVSIYKQEVVEFGNEVVLGFKIVNHERRALNFTYNVKLNIPGFPLKEFNESVLVPYLKSFEYGIKFIPREIGVIKANITIHKDDMKILVEEVNFFIEVTRIN